MKQMELGMSGDNQSTVMRKYEATGRDGAIEIRVWRPATSQPISVVGISEFNGSSGQ